ncbi:MAG TPA: hypothetical protein DCZ94_11415 [Lentisphaeria bacterium]|nr:MAG: hypothetical protein A2X48_17505 [Lentisphaerae bacterium GWF2_49_21]HBC87555.1 hypothetical protein [Lentisphaeria bacterium]
MWLFSILAIIMVVGTAICYLVMGTLPEMYIHMFAYGFLLAGIGYLIELMKKREKNMEAHMEWILDKKFKIFAEELKTIRTLILKLEDRRESSVEPLAPFIPPLVLPRRENGLKDEKPIFSAPISKQKFED